MRRELASGAERPFYVEVPPGARAGTSLTVETPFGSVEAIVPPNMSVGDKFTISAAEPVASGAGVGTDGTLTLVGMCDYLTRELCVEGALRSRVIDACDQLGIDADALKVAPSVPAGSSVQAVRHMLQRQQLEAGSSSSAPADTGGKSEPPLVKVCAVLERELGIDGAPAWVVMQACEMLGIEASEPESEEGLRELALEALALIGGEGALESLTPREPAGKEAAASAGAASSAGTTASALELELEGDALLALELLLARKCVAAIVGDENVEQVITRAGGKLPSQTPTAVAMLDTQTAGAQVFKSFANFGGEVMKRFSPRSDDDGERESQPRIVEITRGKSMNGVAMLAGGLLTGGGEPSVAEPTKPTPVPMLTEPQLQRMSTDERIAYVVRATAAEAEHENYKASLTAAADGKETIGHAHRRRRELLAAATPGTGVTAQVVFGGKSNRRPSAPTIDMDRCMPCGGSGKTSALLTKAQALAAAAPPADPDAFDCQVCFGDGEYCISSNCADRHFYCGDCIRGTLTAIIEMGQFPGAGPKTPAHPP